MPRLRHHERDVDLIGSAGIGKPPGDDLPLPEAAGYPVVFRCDQVDVARRSPGCRRSPPWAMSGKSAWWRRAREGGKARRITRANQHMGCLAPGKQPRVGGIGPPGAGCCSRDRPGEGRSQQGHTEPGAPATPQLSPQEDPCHGQRRTPVYLIDSGGIEKRPAALAGLGWPPILAPMTTAFFLIFPISPPAS